MRRFLAVLSVVFLLTFSQRNYAHLIEVTIYADNAYPPYSYVEDGMARGVYVDVLNIVFKRMEHYHVTIKPVPFKRGLRLIEAGRGFAIFPPYYYANRRPYISPYSMPILDEDVVVYCHSDVMKDRSRPNWPGDFYGLTIGINEAFSIGGAAFWQAKERGKLRVETASNNRENILKLRAKRIDCYINDRLSIQWEIAKLREEGVKISKDAFTLAVEVSSERGYIGYTNQQLESYPFKDDFVAEFDRVLMDMQNRGEVDSILGSYTPKL